MKIIITIIIIIIITIIITDDAATADDDNEDDATCKMLKWTISLRSYDTLYRWHILGIW